MNLYDVAIVGGGPAGLNAAVVLGRCQRKIILFDTGKPRNVRSKGIHNYLTRDHIAPLDFLHIAHEEIKKYGIKFHYLKVINAVKNEEGIFKITDRRHQVYYSKKLLLATGLSDILPRIKGFSACYGKTVFHCPYCDGWEIRNKKIGVYAKNKNGFELAVSLKTWSSQVSLFTDGKKYLKATQVQVLADLDIPVFTKPLQQLKHEDGNLKKIIFADNTYEPCDALFFVNGYDQQASLAENLGCVFTDKGVVMTDKTQGTKVKGLFVAGDASKDMHFVVVAASEGAKAGVVINKELQKENVEILLKSKRAIEPLKKRVR
ncbi:MAG TPA: NAD(P)/FAD-dependent oxidoreductase [Chitinophagaceae bacterium]